MTMKTLGRPSAYEIRMRVSPMASATMVLLLLHPCLTTAFQQSPVSSLHHLSKINLLSSASTVEATSSSDVTEEAVQITASVWDEQYEQLISFKEEYGHCNFPLNASVELTKRYPTLATFCLNQRKEYARRRYYRKRMRVMSLYLFDRTMRYRRLVENGFDFSSKTAVWYEKYHELIQYQSRNGHVRVAEKENLQLFNWIRTQRCRRKGTKGPPLSHTQIELLDNIGFEWESGVFEVTWMEKYNALVAFQNKHGHLLIHSSEPLYQWMGRQRSRREGKGFDSPLSAEQIRLLDEIEFSWKPERYDAIWNVAYNELAQFHKKYGHCQPLDSTHKELYHWSHSQRKKRDKELLSANQIELLDKIDFPWESRIFRRNQMSNHLLEYSNQHGHLHVSHEENPDLYDWMTLQRKRYHGSKHYTNPCSDSQIEFLEELHFCWSLDRKDRIWHDKYTEVAEFYKDHGHVQVAREDNPSLYNWIQSQEKRYKGIKGQKPLSEEELELLEDIDFSFFDNQPRMTWNTRYAELVTYQEENDGQFPNHKDDPKVNRWMRQQRMRLRGSYGYVPLLDEQKSMLEIIDFPMLPIGKRRRGWYEKYDELVAFWKRHGHFFVAIVESENFSLVQWVRRQRKRCNGTDLSSRPLSKSEKYLLDRIGFAWTSDQFEVQWQTMYNELVEFWGEHGHLGVKELENESLYNWMLRQRRRYKGEGSSDIPDHQIEQLEKIGFQWSLRE